jgi:hypothetical protein
MSCVKEEGPPICICHFAGENCDMSEISPGLAAMHAARFRKKWGRHQFPPSAHRCKARSKTTGEQCKRWARRKPNGTRYPTCWWHGSGGNRDHEKRGARLWRKRAEQYDAEHGDQTTPMEAEFKRR